MDLTTTYMGLQLKNPLVPSASPLSRDLDNIKRLEDAGASAIVMYSLFEEQIEHEQRELDHFLAQGTESYQEAVSYFPEAEDYNLGPDEYLEHIRSAKDSTAIPIILSIIIRIPPSDGKTIKYGSIIENNVIIMIEHMISIVSVNIAADC